MSLYLRDVTFYDWRTGRMHEGGVRVDDTIHLVDEQPAAGDRVLDCSGQFAMEGLTCGHHHIYSALARGMPAPPRAPRGFAEILELVWWRLDRQLDLDMVRASALAAGLDCLRCGVTRIIDHHASPNAVTGSLSVIADAFDELGLSHVLCYELSDRDGPESAEAGLAEHEAYLSSGRCGLVGLHASFTVGDRLLADAVDLARRFGTGVHVHVAEDGVDQARCEADHGCRVVERLSRAGALDLPGTLLVHGLHLSDDERALVAGSPSWVAANVESNLNNNVGAFHRGGFDPARIMLGTDGLHSDMLRSLRASYFLGQSTDGLTMDQAWRECWNAQRYLEAHHSKVARRNDVVVFDYAPPTPLATENVLGHVFFGLDARHVRTVITGGRVVLADRQPTTIDEPDTLRFCRGQARRLWDALESS